MSEEVQMISIEKIRILNPRLRDKRKFAKILESIRNLGLKKPIKISLRSEKGARSDEYDLVCGQGRIEAFLALGHQEIPAVVVDVSKEDRLLMSLVENMARRFPAPLDLIREIERLKQLGYSNVIIAQKLDISDVMVGGLIALSNAGEERLLDAAVKGKIPMTVAMEIAKAETVDTQRELLKAYEGNQLNHASIRTVKRLLDQRRFLGKSLKRNYSRGKERNRTTADGLVNAFRKESQRQKVMIKKAKLCEAKLVFLVAGFKSLLDDDNFVTLLRAEGLYTLPKFLSEKMRQDLRKAA